MDFGPYILLGALLQLLIAVIVFIRVVNKARHAPIPQPQSHDITSARADVPLDTSLAGLEISISADAPSASVHAPLKKGDWIPSPPEPRVSTQLPEHEVAVAEKPVFAPSASPVAPASAAREPVVVPTPAPEVIVGPLPAPTLPAVPPAPTPLAQSDQPPAPTPPAQPPAPTTQLSAVPAVLLDEEWIAAVQSGGEAVDPQLEDDELSAEIAALVSSPEVEPPLAEPPASEPVPSEPPASEPVPFEPPVLESAPVEPAPIEWPVAAPPAPSPAEPAPVTGVVWQPPAPEPGPLPTGAVLPFAAAAQPAEEPDSARPMRPRVRVHVPGQPDGLAEAANVTPTVVPALEADPARQAVGDIVLAAPVEMWFGEHRVGVKAGSATYLRFRKYADVLLGELKAVDERTR